MQKHKDTSLIQWLAGAFIIILSLTPGAEAIQNVLDSGGYNYYHTIAVDLNGDVYTWGSNANGQLGLGNYTDKTTPQKVPGIYNVVDVAAGVATSYAVDADGYLWTWGRGSEGQLGDGTWGGYQSNLSPAKLTSITNVVDVEADYYHAVVLDAEGYIYTFGHNGAGQLGINSTQNKNTPQLVDIPPVKDIATGYLHCVALLANGTVMAWGSDDYGQVGDGTTCSNTKLPCTVVDANDDPLTSVKFITAGRTGNFSILGDGTVMTWGANWEGELGTGDSYVLKTYAVEATEIYNAVSVQLGWYHSAAKLYNGTIVTLGNNVHGQLGIGSYDWDDHLSPETVDITSADTLFVGPHSTFVEKVDGSYWAWGRNDNGQLGIGNTTSPITGPTETGFQRLFE